MTSAEHHDEQVQLHLFAVDDPRLWEFRSRLSDAEFAIPGLDEQEWDTFQPSLPRRDGPTPPAGPMSSWIPTR